MPAQMKVPQTQMAKEPLRPVSHRTHKIRALKALTPAQTRAAHQAELLSRIRVKMKGVPDKVRLLKKVLLTIARAAALVNHKTT